MSRKSRRRSTGQQPDQAPVLLPQVLITVTETGLLEVTVDGGPYPPPSGTQAWTRAEFGSLLDAIAQDQTAPVLIFFVNVTISHGYYPAGKSGCSQT